MTLSRTGRYRPNRPGWFDMLTAGRPGTCSSSLRAGAYGRRRMLATGTLTSAAGDCAGDSSGPQLSQPPQAPCTLPADRTASHSAILRRPSEAGARAAIRLKAASTRRRRVRGPRAEAAYAALTMITRPTRTWSSMRLTGARASSTQGLGDGVCNPGSRVGERKHVCRHDDWVPPRIGLAFDRGKSREALRREYVPSQQRERRRQTP